MKTLIFIETILLLLLAGSGKDTTSTDGFRKADVTYLSFSSKKVLVLKEHGIPPGSRRAVLLYGPRKLCKRMVCYLFKEHRLYVCKPCDCDGIRDLDHDHDRQDRDRFDLEECAAGKDPGGDLHAAVRGGADPRLRE